jgi:hypothetical protein
VRVEVDAEGRPKAISENGERTTDNVLSDLGPRTSDIGYRPVTDILEEWRIDDEWWRVPIHRRCFEVVLEGGAHMVVFQDLTTDTWHLQMP